MMLTLINLSHPLHSDALAALSQMAGDDVRVIDVPVQVDVNEPLAGVIKVLVDQIAELAGGNLLDIDMVIPPGLSYIAMAILPEMARRTSGRMPHVVRLIRLDGLPPKFMPVEIVRSYVFGHSYANFGEYGELEL